MMRLSLALEQAKPFTVQMAYVAYYIWLSRNRWVFESRTLSMLFVPGHTLIQVMEVLHLESANLTLMIWTGRVSDQLFERPIGYLFPESSQL